MKQVSAILPIFNEEKTVKDIVLTLAKSPLISEIICVDDGSTDKSFEILKSLKENKLKILKFKKNHGKGFALSCGIKKAKGEIVAFFDTDLLKLSQKHIEKLLKPILSGNFKAVLGAPILKRSEKYRPWVIYLTGERAYFRKDLLPYLKEMKKKRYGIEVFLNSLFKKEETKIVYLENLISPPKWGKRNFEEGMKEYLKEVKEITLELSKMTGLVPEDYQILKELSKIVSFEEFQKKIKEIHDKKIKRILRKYLKI